MEREDVRLSRRDLGGGSAEGWLSSRSIDSRWDQFLQATPLGHFEQSTLWAEAKRCEGWWPLRVLLTLDGQLAGGAQILVRRTRFGKVGYINRAPVVVPEDPALLDFLIEMFIRTAKREKLRGLVIRPPDESRFDDKVWVRSGFLPNRIIKFDSATLLLDLAAGMDALKRGMRKTVRQAFKQAEQRGIKVREGGEDDISTFFTLLVATCERQGKKPQPSTEAAFREVWKALHPAGCVRLLLAEFEGEVIAGSFNFCFGERVTGWRKGWSGKHRDRHPNHALVANLLQWAHDHGYKVFDFGGLERDVAESLLQGRVLPEGQKTGKDFAHLGYGGTPRLLPNSHVYIPNPLLRFAYRTWDLGRTVKRFQRTKVGGNREPAAGPAKAPTL